MSLLWKIGLGLVLLGVALIFIASMRTAGETKDGKTKIAVGGFIGPIPFGFGNDKNWVMFVVIIAVVVFVFWIIVNLIGI